MRVYGKTGTADSIGIKDEKPWGVEVGVFGRPHSWFIAVAEPTDTTLCEPTNPRRLAVAVVVPRSATGASVAGPAAMEILAAAQANGYFPVAQPSPARGGRARAPATGARSRRRRPSPSPSPVRAAARIARRDAAAVSAAASAAPAAAASPSRRAAASPAAAAPVAGGDSRARRPRSVADTAAPSPRPVLNAGDRIGDWVVEEPLGEGGMGAVYRVHSALTERLQAALKILKTTSEPEARARFVREAESLSALSHPGIVRVMAFGEDPVRGLPYLAMELADRRDPQEPPAARSARAPRRRSPRSRRWPRPSSTPTRPASTTAT